MNEISREERQQLRAFAEDELEHGWSTATVIVEALSLLALLDELDKREKREALLVKLVTHLITYPEGENSPIRFVTSTFDPNCDYCNAGECTDAENDALNAVYDSLPSEGV